MTQPQNEMTVLVADDNTSIRHLISVTLTKLGFKVIEATDGLDAWQKFETEKPDLSILDIMMPKFFGWDVLKKIKGKNPSAKVLIMTAVYTKNSYRRTTIHDLMADEYITKPFELSSFIAVVQKLLTPVSEVQ